MEGSSTSCVCTSPCPFQCLLDEVIKLLIALKLHTIMTVWGPLDLFIRADPNSLVSRTALSPESRKPDEGNKAFPAFPAPAATVPMSTT